MKRKPIKRIKIGNVLFGIVFVCLSCQEEPINIPEEVFNERRLNRISLTEFENKVGDNYEDGKLKSLFDVNRHKNSISNSRLENSDDAWIITDEIIMIEKESTTFYTFRIGTNSSVSKFYNLIITTDENENIISSRILEYIPSDSWLLDSSGPFTGSVKTQFNDIFLNIELNDLLTSRDQYQCLINIHTEWECNYGENHAPGQGTSCTSWELIFTYVYGPCPESFDDGSDDSLPIDTAGNGGNGSGGSGTSVNNEDNCVEGLDNACNEYETSIMSPRDNLQEETPCPGDPVPNPEIAPQNGSSGTKGALHGCTRYDDDGCQGEDNRNEYHYGIDIKNNYGNPIYAMFDGEVLVNYHQKGKAGYVTRIRSELPNGDIIIYQYFHMQNEGRLEVGTEISSGDVVGYQGNSGNLKNAINDGRVESHVHIKMNLYDGSGDSYDYLNNFKDNPINPADYMHTQIDEQGNSNTPDC